MCRKQFFGQMGKQNVLTFNKLQLVKKGVFATVLIRIIFTRYKRVYITSPCLLIKCRAVFCSPSLSHSHASSVTPSHLICLSHTNTLAHSKLFFVRMSNLDFCHFQRGGNCFLFFLFLFSLCRPHFNSVSASAPPPSTDPPSSEGLLPLLQRVLC